MKRIIAVAAASAMVGSASAWAHVSDAEFAALKAQFAGMAQRVSTLEAQNQRLREQQHGANAVTVQDLAATNSEVEALKSQRSAASWADNIMLKGDFRYRYESIDEGGKDDRSRQRVRARAAIIAKGPANTELGLGFATGSSDPVSTNQTLGGGASTKNINLDLAYARWNATDDIALTAGKYKNPFYLPMKSGLIWDGDLTPEGFAFNYKRDMLFANAAFMFVESDEKNDDQGVHGLQVGLMHEFADNMQLTAAVAYYYMAVKGRAGVYDAEDFFGNTTVIDGNGAEVYASDFSLFNASLELSTDLLEVPVSFYADYVQNDDADDYDSGYLAGIIVGKARNPGEWKFQYQYQKLEANAVLGAWTDSDFAGGGTDGEGSKFSLGYALTKKWSLAATYFDTSRGIDLGGDVDYKRLQLDTSFKY